MSITALPRRALTAWREHRQQAREYASGADLLAAPSIADAVAVELPPWRDAPTGDTACGTCGGRRCRPWREGRDCRHDGITDRTAYSAAGSLPAAGRHTLTVRLAHWARIDRLHQLRYAVGVAPGRYAAKLGRPVMLPRHVAVLP